MSDYLLLEDGDQLLLEDGSGSLLLEESSAPTVSGLLTGTFGSLTGTLVGSSIVLDSYWEATLQASPWRADLVVLVD